MIPMFQGDNDPELILPFPTCLVDRCALYMAADPLHQKG